MNIPPLKSTLLGLLLVPALVGAMENPPSAAPKQNDQHPIRSIDWPWKRRVSFDHELDTVVGRARELQDYFPRLKDSRIARLTCGHLVLSLAMILGSYKLLAIMAETS